MEEKRSAVALGTFDGVHLGHRAVLRAASEQEKNGLVPCAFTFRPESVLRKTGGQAGYIYGSGRKADIMERLGIRRVYAPVFSEVCGLSGREFTEDILIRRMNAGFVCCGNDFRFGKNASCGTDELRLLGREYGFEVMTVEEVRHGGAAVSSSLIRRLLQSGDIAGANALLGEPYTVSGEAVHGKEIGRTINFPTVNQLFGEGQLVPKYGVYSAETDIDGASYSAVMNIGVKPTIAGERSPLAETHILGFSGDLYGRQLDIRIRRFIRSEHRFASLEELKAQIARDILSAENDI